MSPEEPREQMILEHYRSKGTWQQLDNVVDTNLSDQLMKLDQSECRQKVRRSLKALPVSERLAVEATVLEGLSLRVAGRRLNVSAMTVQRRQKRGLERMQSSLERHQLSF